MPPKLTPVAEALSRVLADMKTMPTESVSLQDAHGRILSEDALATISYPPSDMSAMDGYAIIAADTANALNAQVSLRQIGESQAGDRFVGVLSPGETVRVFTGAPLPACADAVEMQENTTRSNDQITFKQKVEAGKFIRVRGMDFNKDDVILPKGMRITARGLGLLASANIAAVHVAKKPRIAYLATGDELVMPGEAIGPDQIVSSNSIAVAAYIRSFGGEPVSLGIANDTPQSLRAAIANAEGCDALVTIGGASVGDYDLVRTVLGEEGLEMNFYKIAMRPGKPFIFGKLAGIPLFGLPGNPVSAGITSLLLLRPAIEKMLGLVQHSEMLMQATLGCDMPDNDQRQDYIRAELSRDEKGDLIARPYGQQDSAMMRNFAHADCLIIRAPFAPPAAQGDQVDIAILALGNETY